MPLTLRLLVPVIELGFDYLEFLNGIEDGGRCIYCCCWGWLPRNQLVGFLHQCSLAAPVNSGVINNLVFKVIVWQFEEQYEKK